MRVIRLLTLILALLVMAACQSSAPPTAVPPTQAALPDATGDGAPTLELPQSGGGTDIPPQPATPQNQGAIATFSAGVGQNAVINAPGTITFAESTPELVGGAQQGAATPVPLAQSFTRLVYVQIGGAGSQTLTVELARDGTLTRNGVAAVLPASEVTAVINAIEAIRFFDIGGTFVGPSIPEGAYVYSLTIETSDGAGRSLDAHEAFTPPDLQSFFYNLSQLGVLPMPS